MDEIGSSTSSLNRIINFKVLFMVTQFIGAAIIVLTIFLVYTALGGVGWTDLNLRFNLHPLLMTVGMVFLYGNCKRLFTLDDLCTTL